MVCGYVGGVGVGFAHVEDAGDVFEGFYEFLHFFGGGFVATCVAPVAVGVLFAEFDVEGAYEAAYLVVVVDYHAVAVFGIDFAVAVEVGVGGGGDFGGFVEGPFAVGDYLVDVAGAYCFGEFFVKEHTEDFLGEFEGDVAGRHVEFAVEGGEVGEVAGPPGLVEVYVGEFHQVGEDAFLYQ